MDETNTAPRFDGHPTQWRRQDLRRPAAGPKVCNVNNVNNKFIEREGTKVSNALECRLQY